MRPLVVPIETKPTKLGPKSLLFVVYGDGRQSWHVSEPGGLTMFGLDYERAKAFFADDETVAVRRAE